MRITIRREFDQLRVRPEYGARYPFLRLRQIEALTQLIRIGRHLLGQPRPVLPVARKRAERRAKLLERLVEELQAFDARYLLAVPDTALREIQVLHCDAIARLDIAYQANQPELEDVRCGP